MPVHVFILLLQKTFKEGHYQKLFLEQKGKQKFNSEKTNTVYNIKTY